MRPIIIALAAVLTAIQQNDRVQWIAGCWQRTTPTRTVSENWLAVPGGSLVGVAETKSGDRVVEYETIRIFARNDTLIYLAQPSGQAFAEFKTPISNTELAFENPAHDFPKRVVYRQGPADSLFARVEAGERGFDVRMQRIACPTNDANKEAQVRALDSLWARNYQVHDTANALSLMDEKFVMTTARGVKDRAQELNDVRAQAGLRMHYFRTADPRVQIHGDAALVSGSAEWSYDYNGRRSDVRRAYGAVYRAGGPLGWRMVALHIAPAPAAQP